MLNIELPYDLAILLLSILYPRAIKMYIYTKTCIGKFITALFIIAKRWKQFKYPLTDE